MISEAKQTKKHSSLSQGSDGGCADLRAVRWAGGAGWWCRRGGLGSGWVNGLEVVVTNWKREEGICGETR